MAEALAKRAPKYALVLSSPLPRAKETALTIAGRLDAIEPGLLPEMGGVIGDRIFGELRTLADWAEVLREREDARTFATEQLATWARIATRVGEKDRILIEQVSTRPTCDVNGIIGGYTGEGSKTVIPGTASAKVSFRLVGEQNPGKIREAFRAFVRQRLPGDCSAEFINHAQNPALQLPYDSPALGKAQAALAAEWGRKAVAVGTGGSIPIVGDFKHVLGMDSLLVGFGLDDDRVHSPNEKYSLTSFHKGIRSWARILSALAD